MDLFWNFITNLIEFECWKMTFKIPEMIFHSGFRSWFLICPWILGHNYWTSPRIFEWFVKFCTTPRISITLNMKSFRLPLNFPLYPLGFQVFQIFINLRISNVLNTEPYRGRIQEKPNIPSCGFYRNRDSITAPILISPCNHHIIFENSMFIVHFICISKCIYI